jgi:hypothetical protein
MPTLRDISVDFQPKKLVFIEELIVEFIHEDVGHVRIDCSRVNPYK